MQLTSSRGCKKGAPAVARLSQLQRPGTPGGSADTTNTQQAATPTAAAPAAVAPAAAGAAAAGVAGMPAGGPDGGGAGGMGFDPTEEDISSDECDGNYIDGYGTDDDVTQGCRPNGGSNYVDLSLTYDAATGKFAGSLITNQCNAKDNFEFSTNPECITAVRVFDSIAQGCLLPYNAYALTTLA